MCDEETIVSIRYIFTCGERLQRVQYVFGPVEIVGQQVVGRIDVNAADQHHGIRAVVGRINRTVAGGRRHVSPFTARIDSLRTKLHTRVIIVTCDIRVKAGRAAVGDGGGIYGLFDFYVFYLFSNVIRISDEIILLFDRYSRASDGERSRGGRKVVVPRRRRGRKRKTIEISLTRAATPGAGTRNTRGFTVHPRAKINRDFRRLRVYCRLHRRNYV